MEWSFEETDLGDEAHPNTAIFRVTRGGEEVELRGASLGGGRVEVSEIDDQPWGSFVYFRDPDGNGWALQQTVPRAAS